MENHANMSVRTYMLLRNGTRVTIQSAKEVSESCASLRALAVDVAALVVVAIPSPSESEHESLEDFVAPPTGDLLYAVVRNNKEDATLTSQIIKSSTRSSGVGCTGGTISIAQR